MLTVEEITRRFHAEQKNPIRPTKATDLPPTFESITNEWLTAVLGSVPGAEVISHELGPEDDGTSNRRFIYMTWNDEGQAAGLPKSVFCKGTQSLESRFILGLNGGVKAEVNAYKVLLPKLGVIAPCPFHAIYDPETLNSIIVLEDLADKVNFCTMETDLTYELAQSQMRLLAELHATFYESDALDNELSMFDTWEDFFFITCDDLGWADASIKGFNASKEVVPPRLFAREPEVWPATVKAGRAHSTMPQGMIHSDVHLKNWFITPDGEMGINDWQNCTKGNGSRDLAYCISTGLTPEKRREWERDLLEYYIDQFEAFGGPRLDFDLTFKRYKQQLFMALSWWSGTLGRPEGAPMMQPQETSLEFIRRISIAIDDLDALDSFDDQAVG
ncbi:MAG: phosphotransferase [Pseudomonadales bacterium]|nr:phosphotransferase [Pseudomonadales bacterium]